VNDRIDHAAAEALFVELSGLPPDDARCLELRQRIVVMYHPVAKRIAARFLGRGPDREDLEQVAAIGLVKAVERFDPDRGIAFLRFAVPTMVGEVRRHFRDSAWSIRMPRRLSELYLALNTASRDLAQQLGHAPTPSQLAAHLSITVDEVLEGLEAGHSYRAESLDAAAVGDDNGLVDRLGVADPAFDAAEDRADLRPALAKLPPRERTILALRFFEGLTQTQIAARVGLSQMQVSRLLARSLERIRADLTD
jgi:RNA polymerase sigma-B factor